MKFEFSAGAVVYKREGERLLFLLLISNNGDYGFPKGHIEKGETPEIAALREIQEESALEPKIVSGFSEVIEYFFQEKGEKIHKWAKFFLAEADEKNVKISAEHKAFEWADYGTALSKIRFRNSRELLGHAYDYIRRVEVISKINEQYSSLPSRRGDWELSEKLVPGEGPLNAKVVILGQAPGAEEDKRMRPFVGRSGELLNRMLKNAGIKREKAYVLSIVQFFPPKNRLPTKEEVAACMPFLMMQLSTINPEGIILLGNLACNTMLGDGSVEKNHGKIVERDGRKFLITFHPAAALRSKSRIPKIEEDLKKFKEALPDIFESKEYK